MTFATIVARGKCREEAYYAEEVLVSFCLASEVA